MAVSPSTSRGSSGTSAGSVVGHATNTSSATTSGTSFAAGADILAADLSFIADGTSDYLVTVSARQWSNTGTSLPHNRLSLKLDGADAGVFIDTSLATGQAVVVSGSVVIAAPSAGAHTVNGRFWVSAGTGTLTAGAGGAGGGVSTPLVVTVTTL